MYNTRRENGRRIGAGELDTRIFCFSREYAHAEREINTEPATMLHNTIIILLI